MRFVTCRCFVSAIAERIMRSRSSLTGRPTPEVPLPTNGTTSAQSRRKSQNPPSPSAGAQTGLRVVRAIRHSSDLVLPMAKAILRARHGRLCAGHRVQSPGRGPGAFALAGSQTPAQERGSLRVDGGAYPFKKRTWGKLRMTWVAHDIRDQIVDFVRGWSSAADLRVRQLLHWMGLSSRQYTRWQDRYGHANGSPKPVDRDSELEPWERQAILDFYDRNQLEGYRRLAFMMLDQDVVAVSPSSVYRVLHGAGLLQRWSRPTRKGRGFVQPLAPHQHWHIDFSYLNIGGTFYYLCSVLDGASRFIVAWIIRPSMTQADA